MKFSKCRLILGCENVQWEIVGNFFNVYYGLGFMLSEYFLMEMREFCVIGMIRQTRRDLLETVCCVYIRI